MNYTVLAIINNRSDRAPFHDMFYWDQDKDIN